MNNLHTWRRAGVVAAVATLGLTVSACAGSDDAGSGSTSAAKSIRLAAVLPNTSDPFFASISCGALDKAKELGVELKTYNSTTPDANTMSSNFQTALLGSPNGVLVSPFNNNQFIAQYKQQMAKGVPVVTQSSTDPQSEFKAIFSDTDTAPLAADVADLIPQGAGSMVFLGGAPGIPPLEQRTKPFVEAVAKQRSDLKALPTDYSGFDVNKTTTTVSSLILAHSDLKLVIAADGPDALGAAAAIKQADKAGKIALIAFDAVPGEVDALRAGTITALVAQNPTDIGAKSVQALVDYLKAHPNGGPVTPAGKEAVANKVITSKNVDDPATKPFLYRAGC